MVWFEEKWCEMYTRGEEGRKRRNVVEQIIEKRRSKYEKGCREEHDCKNRTIGLLTAACITHRVAAGKEGDDAKLTGNRMWI